MTDKTRILIVEDEAIVAMDLRRRLEKLGYSVVGEAGTKDEAVALALSATPDIILMDIRLRGSGDGIAAAEEIRLKRPVPVIFLSAFSDEGTLLRAKVTEPYGYVVKPVQERELRAAIEVALYRHRTEEALHRVERWMSATLGSIGDAVLSTDVNGRVSYMNAVAESLTGWTGAEAMGVEFDVVLPFRAADGTPVPSLVRRVLSDGLVVDLDPGVTLARRDGSVIGVEDSAAPIRGDAGAINGVVIIFRDCTAKVRAAANLKSVEAQLLQSQKMESLGRLAGGVAHDFRNLMTVVSGYAESVASDPLLPPQHKVSLDLIRTAAGSASDMTAQLLAFSRKQVLKPVPTDLNDLVRRDSTLLTRLLGASVRLDLRLAPGTAMTLVDPPQISQVLMNLVVNARDAMPGGGSIRVTTETGAVLPPGADPSAKEFVLLTVADDGAGMDDATRRRAFEPFFTTKEVGSGTGLGLSIVHGIVKQSGGHIELESRPGAGTMLRIWLPRAGAAPAPLPGPVATPNTGHEVVLVVDDNAAVRGLIQTILGKKGYSVLVAEDGKAAIGLVEKQDLRISLVITDILMPVMSGPQLATKLSSIKPDLKFLYVSGFSDIAVASNGQLPHGSAFLEKPFTSSVLLRKVRDVLDAVAS